MTQTNPELRVSPAVRRQRDRREYEARRWTDTVTAANVVLNDLPKDQPTPLPDFFSRVAEKSAADTRLLQLVFNHLLETNKLSLNVLRGVLPTAKSQPQETQETHETNPSAGARADVDSADLSEAEEEEAEEEAEGEE